MFSRVSRKRLRIAGLTQRQFAALAGVSEGHLSLVLSGLREPGPRLLRAWEQVVEPLVRANMEREERVNPRPTVAGVEVGARS